MINIEVAGSKVSGVSDSLPLAITTENGWTITFESDINVSRSVDDSGPLSGEDPETASTLAESLIGLTIRSVDTNGGTLHLEFDGPLEISAAPDPDFESWNVVGPGKERVVCLAGGEMAYWSAN